jgi:hypothetical protein
MKIQTIPTEPAYHTEQSPMQVEFGHLFDAIYSFELQLR